MLKVGGVFHTYDIQDVIDSRATMILDEESLVEDDPFGDEREVWNGIPFNSVVPAL